MSDCMNMDFGELLHDFKQEISNLKNYKEQQSKKNFESVRSNKSKNFKSLQKSIVSKVNLDIP